MKQGTTEKVKFKKLKRRLRLPEWQCIGLLEAVWRCVATNAPAGDIGRLSNEDIAAAIEYEDDPDELIEHLVECGWLDVDSEHRLIVHDWSEHVPNFIKGGFAKSGRKFADVEAKERPKEAPRVVSKDVAKVPPKVPPKEQANGVELPPTKSSQVKPSPAKPSQANSVQTPSTSVDDAFGGFWSVVHRKVGRDAGARAFAAAVARKSRQMMGSKADAIEYITDAMRCFASSPAAVPDDHTPIHPATWLNQGRYDDDRETWQGEQKREETLQW